MKRETKQLYILLALVALLVCCSFTAFAFEKDAAVTSFSATLYGATNGVPTGEANAICQDDRGYIWIGNYGGLQRYDGVSFETYSDGDGLTSSSIRSVHVDDKGMLWVGSNDKGVYYLSDGHFYQPDNSDDEGLLSVRCFAEDNFGRMWIGCGDGLAYIKDDKVTRFDMADFGYDNSTVYTLSLDAH